MAISETTQLIYVSVDAHQPGKHSESQHLNNVWRFVPKGSLLTVQPDFAQLHVLQDSSKILLQNNVLQYALVILISMLIATLGSVP